MKTWMSALALTVAGAMLATSAFAQSGGAGGASGSGSGAAGGSSSGAGASSGSPSSSPATGSGTGAGSSASDMKSGSGSTSSSGTMSGSSSSDMKSGSDKVKAVQQALKDKGHDPGDVDGKMGPKTQAALRDYQQKEGLKATGRLDSETAAKLGVQAKADTSSSSPAASPRKTK